MNVASLVAKMSPEVYQKLSQCVETGKWFDGQPLNEEQRAQCMQAVMVYQAKVLKSDQHMTVGAHGEIVHKSRQEFKTELAQQDSIARFKQDDF